MGGGRGVNKITLGVECKLELLVTDLRLTADAAKRGFNLRPLVLGCVRSTLMLG